MSVGRQVGGDQYIAGRNRSVSKVGRDQSTGIRVMFYHTANIEFRDCLHTMYQSLHTASRVYSIILTIMLVLRTVIGGRIEGLKGQVNSTRQSRLV